MSDATATTAGREGQDSKGSRDMEKVLSDTRPPLPIGYRLRFDGAQDTVRMGSIVKGGLCQWTILGVEGMPAHGASFYCHADDDVAELALRKIDQFGG